MKNVIVAGARVPARLFRTGILRFFDANELQFHITDLCLRQQNQSVEDLVIADRLVKQGQLTVHKLTGEEMSMTYKLYKSYQPRFIPETVSAIILSSNFGYPISDDDDLLRDVVWKDFYSPVHTSARLIDDLIKDAIAQGLVLERDIIREILYTT